MRDQDTPSRASNMEKAEGDRHDTSGRDRADEAGRQEQLVGRHPRHQDPTRLDEERTSDNSTVDNGGLSSGRQGDPVMPKDDATLETKI